MSGYNSPWAGTGFGTTETTSGGTTQASGSGFLVGIVAGGASGNIASVTGQINGVADGNVYTSQLILSIGFGSKFLYLYACAPGDGGGNVAGNGGANHTIAVVLTNPAALSVSLIEIPNCAPIDLIPAGTTNSSGTVLTGPSIKTSVPNEFVINLFGTGGSGSAETISDSGAGFTLGTVQQAVNTGPNAAWSYAIPAAHGTTVADTFTQTNPDSLGIIAISLKPAAPTITSQPSSTVGNVGSTASLSVSATAYSGSLSYQWHRASPTSIYSSNPGSFSPISGATSATYTSGTLSSSDNGVWLYCAVTDSKGTVNTDYVRLWVSGLPSAGKGNLLGAAWTVEHAHDEAWSTHDSLVLKTGGIASQTSQVGYNLWQTYLLGAPSRTGSESVMLGALSVSAVATLKNHGVLSGTLGVLVVVATNFTGYHAALSKTLDALSSVSAGTDKNHSVLNTTLGTLTASATSTMSVAGVVRVAYFQGESSGGPSTDTGSADPGTGNAIIAFVSIWNQGSTPTQPTIAGTGSFSTIQITPSGGSPQDFWDDGVQGDSYFAMNPSSTAGSQVVIGTGHSPSVGSCSPFACSYSGVDTSSVSATSVLRTSPGSGTNGLVGQAVVVPVGAVLLCYAIDSWTGVTELTPGTINGPATVDNTTSFGCITEYAGTGASITPSWTASGGTASSSAVDIFQVLIPATVVGRSAATAVTLGALTSVSASTDKNHGTLAKTLAALTVSAASTDKNHGTLARTLGALTSSATSTDKVHGTLSATLSAVTASSVAGDAHKGATSVTLTALVVSSASTNKNHGAVSSTLGSLTSSAAATDKNHGTLTQTLAALAVSSASTDKLHGVLSSALGALTVSAAGTNRNHAALSATLASLTVSAVSTDANHGTLNTTLAAASSVSASTNKSHASLAVSFANVTIAATGGAGGSSASLSLTLAALASNAAGTVKQHAALNVTLMVLVSSGAGISSTRGTLSVALGSLGSVSAGTNKNHGALSSTLGTLAVSSASVDKNHAALSVILSAVAASSTAQLGAGAHLSVVLNALAVSSAATNKNHGSFVKSLSALTSASGSAVKLHGAVSATLSALTCVLHIVEGSKASLAVTLASIACVSHGALRIAASLVPTLAAVALNTQGVSKRKSQLSLILGSLTCESNSARPAGGEVLITLQALAIVASATRATVIHGYSPIPASRRITVAPDDGGGRTIALLRRIRR